MKILAIETSCDDTAIALVDVKKVGQKITFNILGNKANSQAKLHSEFGGVFPMKAKQEHIKNIEPLYAELLKEAKIKKLKIDAIAVTYGPGLEPSLWVGITFAKKLSEKLKVPIIPVNHMEGHILSFLIQEKKGVKKYSFKISDFKFPAIALLVSGGHTQLIFVKGLHKYKIIGDTRDDAAGEAFDKVARMLGLSYPGGPEISRLANQARKLLITNDELQIKLPRPMMHSKDYDFSFSGLKTAVLYLLRDTKNVDDKFKQKVAREFEDAVADVLTYKTIKAMKDFKAKTLILGGGVSANKHLQNTLKEGVRALDSKIPTFFPTSGLTGDNALMIAIAGYFNYGKRKLKNPNLKATGNLKL